MKKRKTIEHFNAMQ